MTRVLLQFTPEMLSRLKRQAELKGTTLAGLVRVILENWLDGKYQTPSTTQNEPKVL
jgi:hypothetical protein